MSRGTAIKALLFLAGLLPAARLVWLGLHNRLGANPIERKNAGWTTVAAISTKMANRTPVRLALQLSPRAHPL